MAKSGGDVLFASLSLDINYWLFHRGFRTDEEIHEQVKASRTTPAVALHMFYNALTAIARELDRKLPIDLRKRPEVTFHGKFYTKESLEAVADLCFQEMERVQSEIRSKIRQLSTEERPDDELHPWSSEFEVDECQDHSAHQTVQEGENEGAIERSLSEESEERSEVSSMRSIITSAEAAAIEDVNVGTDDMEAQIDQIETYKQHQHLLDVVEMIGAVKPSTGKESRRKQVTNGSLKANSIATVREDQSIELARAQFPGVENPTAFTPPQSRLRLANIIKTGFIIDQQYLGLLSEKLNGNIKAARGENR